MIWTNIKRITRSGFFSFWRNGFVSLASVFIMVITLSVIGSIIFVHALLTSSLQALQDKVDVNVYFVTTAPEDQILAMQKDLQSLPDVANVTYVSRDQELADFKERHADNQLTLQALDELGDNPLGAVLNVKAKDPSEYEGIANYLDQRKNAADGSGNIIDTVNYSQNKQAIDRLNTIIHSAESLGTILTIVLILLSIIITFNTIRLAIYMAREEIAVMRLVGASRTYIRGPFVVSGILYGLAAGLLTLAIFYPICYWLGNASQNFFIGLNIFDYYIANFPLIFLVVVGSGMVIGAVSSFLATHKYLKV
ncbi:MAG TPA: permease-like cell division protein FtsX [Candidatus Paceibacterota bacterium]|nr:permease-like cell division protein FtsX [Candidatus Paceibacterota bacterium]